MDKLEKDIEENMKSIKFMLDQLLNLDNNMLMKPIDTFKYSKCDFESQNK